MTTTESTHADAAQLLASQPGRVFVLGAADTGKTTFCLRVVRMAVEAGLVVGFVDSDIGQSTIGPPTTVGLKMVRTAANLEPETLAHADVLAFVGSVVPRGHLLSLAVATARVVMRAIEHGARLVVVDTPDLVSGVAAQLLHLSQVELCRPRHAVALAHGGELEPLVGVLQRFASLDVLRLDVDPGIPMRSVDERVAARERSLAAALGPAVFRWRIRSTIFLPALPPDLDLAPLDGVLVGIDTGEGDCAGLGILESRDDALRLLTPLQEGVKAVRLGSLRATPEGRITGQVDLRSLLGTD